MAHSAVIDYLLAMGHIVVKLTRNDIVYEQICSHPDIFMCKMGTTPSSDVVFANYNEIGKKYPNNITYNAVCLEKYFIHNLSYCSGRLLEYVKKAGLTTVNVRQGYTKCSCVAVSGNSLITADKGIADKLSSCSNIDVLMISPGHVALPGFDYGFLGGASGCVDNEVIFNGDLSSHPDYQKIVEFIYSHGKKVKYFPNLPLTDIGTIIQCPY